MGPNIFKKIAKMSLELLGLLLELLLELLLLLLYAFYHVLIRGREAPPYNYVINAYSRSSLRGSTRCIKDSIASSGQATPSPPSRLRFTPSTRC